MIKKIMYLGVTILVLGIMISYLLGLSLKTKPATTVTSQADDLNRKSKPPTSQHGFYDVDFAQKMIVHNEQGILMAELVSSRSLDRTLIELATGLRDEQLAITAEYTDLLDGWGEKYSNLSDFHEMDGHDMYPTHPGMAQAVEIVELRTLQGPEFDKLFIKLMLNHHEGAVTMAKSRTGQKVTNNDVTILLLKGIELQQKDLRVLKELQTGMEKK